MNHFEMLNRAEREVNTRALKIKSSAEAGDLDCEYYGALGYISSMHDMGIFNEPQYVTALAVIDAALYEAEDERAKKAAPGAANTESDKAKSINFILGAKCEGVKAQPAVRVHMGIYVDSQMKLSAAGEGVHLLSMLTSLVVALNKAGVPEPLIQRTFESSKTLGGGF